MGVYLSERVRGLEPYTPGEQPQDRRYIKLNTNESPFGPSPKVKAVLEADGFSVVTACCDLPVLMVPARAGTAWIHSP